jgi:uncharacterized protein YecT (DUF1311 family)
MIIRLVSATLFALLVVSPTEAQAPVDAGAESSPTAKIATRIKHHRMPKAPATSAPASVEAVVGRDLLLGGANGLLRFSGQADALQIERFSMVGEVISDPKQECRIDVNGETAIGTKSLGRPDGLLRFEADIPACPFEFDVLDGAVLARPQLQACVFKQADCQASPAGLWGPEGASLPDDAKAKKEARASADAAMNANYQALTARLSDQSKADSLADEQSRFMSDRQETCRTYSHEDLHGFCTIRLTAARAAFLKARLDELPQDVAGKANPKPRRRKSPQ